MNHNKIQYLEQGRQYCCRSMIILELSISKKKYLNISKGLYFLQILFLKMNSIYYVGGRAEFSSQQGRKSNFKPKKHSFDSSAKRPQRSSSRSRKTEPKYSLMRIKSDQSVTKRNLLSSFIFKADDKRNENQKLSEAMSNQKTTHKAQLKCQNKIIFRKTQQPIQNAKKQLRNTIQIAKKFYLKMPIPERSSSRSVRKLQRRSPNPLNSQNPVKLTQQLAEQQSSTSLFDSGVRQMYQISYNNQIFFCSTCLFYMSTVQIRSHHLSCKKPKDRKDYLICWRRLIELLCEYNRHTYSDKLFRLIEYMAEFQGKSQVTESGIYSLELSRILSYQRLISIGDINTITLFRVIEVVGEKIQSHKIII